MITYIEWLTFKLNVYKFF